VPNQEGRPDGETIKQKLKTAAAFADIDLMEYLIRTTYCTRAIGSEVLAETTKEGNLDVVKLLLKCGANPVLPMGDDRTSLHFAASIGREDICSELIHSMISRDDAYKRTSSSNLTAFDILREEQDLGKMATRLQNLADELPQ